MYRAREYVLQRGVGGREGSSKSGFYEPVGSDDNHSSLSERRKIVGGDETGGFDLRVY
jgi:hypothetical protein